MTQWLFIHAHSPMHPGTGTSMGAVDLAVARDKATGLPYLPGSSLKGALRAKAEKNKDLGRDEVKVVFGPDTSAAHESSGAAVIGDANLLFLPMAADKGLFAQVTTRYMLRRFLRDAGERGPRKGVKGIGEKVIEKSEKGSVVAFEALGEVGVEQAPELERALELFPDDLRGEVAPRAVCVDDATFRVLLDQGLDLVTRVRIDPETNTAKSGQLWLEENLPAETVLVAGVGALRDHERVKALVAALKGVTYLGGHVTVGRGRAQLYVEGSP